MKDKIQIILAVVVIAGLILFFSLIQPFFEARSFNKLTGNNASTWDAIWVELRVDGCK